MASPLQPLYSKIKDRQIRLCDVAPRISDEPISCKLRTVSLDENIEYDALSYVWGDANDRQVIWVNGLKLHVGRNLATALTFMRADKIRTMWVDAICINQDDIPERNSQVPLMREIYSKATTTVVWLGASDQIYVPLTFARPFLHDRGQMNHEDFISHISRRVGELDLAKLYPNIPPSVFGPMTEQRLDVAVATRIGDCFNHTSTEDPSNYWSRAWTAQEVAVSRNAILQSRDVTVSFKEVEEFSKYIWSAWADQDIVVKMGLRFYLTPPISLGHPPEPLPTVLAEQRHRHATNPRDKVSYEYIVSARRALLCNPR
ncbi:uncharacterized protein PAC_20188 [Phialocephala subalpina]|uniref:Heterokaryon incompatibility domain-containing protein n=1 Tax=Phialocephala subalpina TaxID=576137 RepID=A0A1L7XZ59_9HELO|nr:uncharacterized protein PAC_20188 [Phialocephala subalpina]